MDGSCSGFLVFIVVCLFITAALKGIKAHSEKRAAEDLRRANPQAWVELQRMQHERQMIENHRKHEYGRVGVNVGLWVLKNMFK